VHGIITRIGENPTLASIKSVREKLGESAKSPNPRVRQAAAIAAKTYLRARIGLP